MGLTRRHDLVRALDAGLHVYVGRLVPEDGQVWLRLRKRVEAIGAPELAALSRLAEVLRTCGGYRSRRSGCTFVDALGGASS